MTNLGASQVYESGDFYRQRYIADGAPEQIAGVSSDVARSSQLYASAPDQHVSRDVELYLGDRSCLSIGSAWSVLSFGIQCC